MAVIYSSTNVVAEPPKPKVSENRRLTMAALIADVRRKAGRVSQKMIESAIKTIVKEYSVEEGISEYGSRKCFPTGINRIELMNSWKGTPQGEAFWDKLYRA